MRQEPHSSLVGVGYPESCEEKLFTRYGLNRETRSLVPLKRSHRELVAGVMPPQAGKTKGTGANITLRMESLGYRLVSENPLTRLNMGVRSGDELAEIAT